MARPGPPYDEWPVSDPEHTDREHLGVTGHESQMLMYDKASNAMYVADVDHEAEKIGNPRRSDRQLQAEETLGEYLERVGDDHGWEWLSDFAREHLEEDEK